MCTTSSRSRAAAIDLYENSRIDCFLLQECRCVRAYLCEHDIHHSPAASGFSAEEGANLHTHTRCTQAADDQVMSLPQYIAIAGYSGALRLTDLKKCTQLLGIILPQYL